MDNMIKVRRYTSFLTSVLLIFSANKLEEDHDVQTNPNPTAVCCYAPNKRPNLLAVSTRGGKKKAAVEVYDITKTSQSPVYTLESPDWNTPPIDVAATKGMILVICYRGKYIYQFQKYKSAAKENQKFAIADSMTFRYPRCIAVNQRCAVVGIEEKGETVPGSLVVFSVPSLQRERQVDLHFVPHSLDMNDMASNFILGMGSNKISIRNVADDIGKEIGKVIAPMHNDTEFFASVFETGNPTLLDRVGAGQPSTSPPEVFAVTCTNASSKESSGNDDMNQNSKVCADRTSDVRRYTWDVEKAAYVDGGIVIMGLGVVGRSGLRLTRDGVCAMSEPNASKLKIYCPR